MNFEMTSTELFLQEDKIIRLGFVPLKIEVITKISGVEFDECYQERVVDEIDDIEVSLIGLHHLKVNKQASGRHKDLADLENLP
jgi:hypothetical protein